MAFVEQKSTGMFDSKLGWNDYVTNSKDEQRKRKSEYADALKAQMNTNNNNHRLGAAKREVADKIGSQALPFITLSPIQDRYRQVKQIP